mgnify:FL=1|jgi:hypothetical protein
MKKKILPTYHETLYHLIKFRISQFNKSKEFLKIDYISFMICSVAASHFNYKNLKSNKDDDIDWHESWKLVKLNTNTSLYKKDKLTIFAISHILHIPKETVRRKLKNLIKKKILKYSTKSGVIFGEKVDIFKPYAQHEVLELSKFLKSLKENRALEALINFKLSDFK